MSDESATATIDQAASRADATTRTVSAISITPVKSLGLHHPQEVELTPTGVPGDRQFFLVDERGRIFVGRRFGPLVRVVPEYDGSRLSLRFPDGSNVSGDVELGDPMTTDFYGFRQLAGREVRGPWSEALSEYAGVPVRLVRAEDCDAYDLSPVTLVSNASIRRLSEEIGDAVDYQRFRMLFTLDGCSEHEEDTWSRIRIGEAVVQVGTDELGAATPRCAVITQDPQTGVRNLDTLGAIKRYRGRTLIGIHFGVYARVETPGRVRVGDAVEPL